MRVFLVAPQEPEIDAGAEVLECLVDEASMPGLVARHVTHEIAHVLVLGELALGFAIQHATGELCRHGADQEVQEFLVQCRRQLAHFRIELGITLEMAAVNVEFELAHHLIPLGAHRGHVHEFHGGIVGFIETRRQKRVGLGLARCVCGRANFVDRDVGHDLSFEWTLATRISANAPALVGPKTSKST